jgi:hypothetical protein
VLIFLPHNQNIEFRLISKQGVGIWQKASDNKLPISMNSPVENPVNPDLMEQPGDWFSTFLKCQIINTALFEYFIMEAENGRQ